tara:strand:+ start:1331 stop:2743 length:1413 start_codon:yes stop_codon:yes gene_type:complete
LNSVEAGITDSAGLNTALSDSGRLSEFRVLMSRRGQARRMAASPVTVSAFIDSPIAISSIFGDTNIENPVTATALLKKQTSMLLVVDDRNTLNIIMGNPTSATLLKASPWFEIYLKQIITHLTPTLNPEDYTTTKVLVTDNAAMGVVFNFAGAIEVIIASPTTVELVAADLTIMANLVDSSVAVNLISESRSTMTIMASEPNAMNSIAASAIAMPVIAASPTAMGRIASNNTAFNTFLASPYFGDNRKNAIANLAGLNPNSYATLNTMIDDPAALTAIVSSLKATTAFAADDDAIAYLATSSNLGIVLNSTTAMSVIGPNDTAMAAFLANAGAWVSLFASSTVKGFIVTSTTLVDIIAGDSALKSYLSTLAVLKGATGIPDGNATSLQSFVGVPSKVLVLLAKEAGIAATFSNYNFGGSTIAGSQAGATLNLTSTAQLPHVAGYSDMTWNLQAIGVTAATLPIITYVDMT